MLTVIKNGTCVTAGDTFQADIVIEAGVIRAIASDYPASGAQIIDASNQLVIPGGIDVHTHLGIDVGIAVSCDDWYTGTLAAACGGTTTVIDHPGFGPAGCSLHHQIRKYHDLARHNAVVDYGFHGVVQHVDDKILEEMRQLVEEHGVSSFKGYLTYSYKLSDCDVLQMLRKLGALGAFTTVHPENDAVVNDLRARLPAEGKLSPIYHARSRPPECEAEAIGRMIYLAKLADDAPLYIVHLSCGIGLDLIEQAQHRGQRVYAETCPQYLVLDEERYNEPDHGGLKYIMSPPLRHKSNQEQLWRGLARGSIHTVATDHCPFNFGTEKQLGRDDFTKCPNGAPGIENRVPLLFSEGVMKNRLNLNRFVDVVATTPAKLFGIYPQKGTIAVGSDADLVLIDPNKEVTLTHSMLHSAVDYTPYEGMKLRGYPTLTMLRGNVIVRDNSFVGSKGQGLFLRRKLPTL